MSTLHEQNRTTSPAIQSYLRYLRAANKAAGTLVAYERALAKWQRWCDEREVDPVEAGRRDVQEYLFHLQDAGYAEATIRNHYVYIGAWYRWLHKEGDIDRNPMNGMDTPSVAEVAKDVVTQEDLSRVLASLEKAKRWRDLAVVSVLYDTGMRSSELTEMLKEDVNLDTGVALIREAKGKRPRFVRLSPTTTRNLDRYLRRRKDSEPFLISGHKGQLTRSGMYQIVKKAFRANGFTVTIGPHDLRHTSATHIAMDVDETTMVTLFGWSSATMARHYARQALQQRALQAHEKASPMEKLGR